MKKINSPKKRLVIVAITVVGLFGLAVFQYIQTQKIKVGSSRQMQVQLLTETLEPPVLEKVKNTKMVYLNTNPRVLTVANVANYKDPGRLVITVSGNGAVFDDSIFFAGERIVYNDKVKVHSAYDLTATVVGLEYSK